MQVSHVSKAKADEISTSQTKIYANSEGATEEQKAITLGSITKKMDRILPPSSP